MVNGSITVENSAGRTRRFLNSNFPGLAPDSLQILILDQPLPHPENWHAGELHCHSDYSNDPVEFGASLKVLQEAGQALGLGYVVCTDHSYDFYYQKTRYMDRTDPSLNFQSYRNEAFELNKTAHKTKPILIPGEEVSCGNHLGENVHLLVAGHPEFLPGLGDGGRRWLNNRPDLTIDQVLERLGETPCFAAHPRVKVGSLERFIFRRGMWNDQDLTPLNTTRPINGLQFWNGTRGRDFVEGRKFWIKHLLTGKRLYPIGANDAHGDLNRNIGVKTPLFSLYQNRNHVFGNVRTVVKSQDKTIEGIQKGLRTGAIFCTDGPYLNLSQELGKILIEARSITVYGAFEKLNIYAGHLGADKEVNVGQWNWVESGPMEFSDSITAPTGAAYIRAEALTATKKFALTAPLFLN